VLHLYKKLKTILVGDLLTEDIDIQSRARVELLFNTSLLVYVISIPLILLMLIQGSYGKIIPTIIGLIAILAHFILLKNQKSAFWSAFLLCSISCVIVVININFNRSVSHLVEPFWMIDVVVYAIFMIGIRWGFIFFGTMSIGFIFYTINHFQLDLIHFSQAPKTDHFFFGLEIAAAVSTLVYLLSMFVAIVGKSEAAMKLSHEKLGVKNELITKQNLEITLLLREIHHRVKNNLQVINSLLNLQSVQIEDPASKRVFEDAQYRIKAIALIHERMYKSSELANIEPVQYFEGLFKDLFRQNITNQNVQLEMEIQLTTWNQDSVVPLGLLVNELISNSLEHALLTADDVIRIELRQLENGVQLNYSDSGVGFQTENNHGFGLELIDTLCQQLSGKMELTTALNHGVNYSFQLLA
jgi:two-component sensor histidine kinase